MSKTSPEVELMETLYLLKVSYSYFQSMSKTSPEVELMETGRSRARLPVVRPLLVEDFTRSRINGNLRVKDLAREGLLVEDFTRSRINGN